MSLSLQRIDHARNGNGKPKSTTVQCKVVRQDDSGIGVAFLFDDAKHQRAVHKFVYDLPGAHGASSLVRHRNGQALIEFALMTPLIVLLILNAVNFGGFLYSWVGIANASRAGVQDAAMGAAYASYPTRASLANINTLVQNETATLPGASSTNPAVTVCQYANGYAINYPLPTATPASNTCSSSYTSPSQDPETITGASGTPHYTVVWIDVTYTYTPFIGVFNTPYLGVVSPPTSIHMRTVMRLLN